MIRSNNPEKFLSEEEFLRVKAKIAGAERLTSAEINLVIVRHCWTDIRRKAEGLFKRYRLDKTADRNCVLILLVTTHREFLIYSDEGIYEKVGQDFWDEVRDVMEEKFRQNEFADGLCKGIHIIAKKLAPLFPYEEGDINEISDEIKFEN